MAPLREMRTPSTGASSLPLKVGGLGVEWDVADLVADEQLMFMLVSRRYERASMIVTSNKPFSGWGEIFGDEVTATAMIDRLVHHAEILSLKGDSYRLKDRDLARPPAARTPETA
jgi:hypothetical protein